MPPPKSGRKREQWNTEEDKSERGNGCARRKE